MGRLDKSKDLKTLVKAFTLFRKDVISTLTIVGSGPQKIKLLILLTSWICKNIST